MNFFFHDGVLARRLRSEQHAAQIVEFAVALPLLVVFVVGIFDFSGAFTLKQKLTNVARDAARAAAADPATDLNSTFGAGSGPTSVSDAFQIIDNYLKANRLNDCGIGPANLTTSGLTWTYSIPTSGGCGITIIINRGYFFPMTGANPPTISCTPQSSAGATVVGTCVSVQYSYFWKFGRVASMFGPILTLPPQISAVAVAMNEN